MTEFDTALSETQTALAGIDEGQIVSSCVMIAGARSIVLYGCGREGLMMRSLAMRLHHLGCRVAMQGDMACPPVGPGDLFLCSAGPGTLSTVDALMKVAGGAGASVLLLTAEPQAPSASLAKQTLLIPAQTMARDQSAGAGVLPMGSVYEAGLFFLFEIMVLRLRGILGQSADDMRARHTNLE